MTLLAADIVERFYTFLWPMMRIGAMMMAAPLFALDSITLRLRVVITLVLSVLIYPLIAWPVIDPVSAEGLLEIVNQLDGFDARGNVKILMATNRPDTLDPALLRPGRLDRKVEFGLPDLEGRASIFQIHARSMNCERDIRFELLARLCPNTTGADIRSVCIEAGMYAIRARRKTVTEKDMIEAVNKVIKGYSKFSATPKYLVYN